MDLNKYLKRNPNNSVTAMVDNIVVYISRRFEKPALLKITESVETIAIFEITVNKESRGFFLPGVVSMKPSTVEFETINGNDYVKCVFNKGDIFIENTNVVQNPHIAYDIFEEFIDCGKVPDFFTYNSIAFIFDKVKKITGSKIPAEHAAFEMLYAFLARNPKNFREMWRLTPMTGEGPKYYKLKDVSHIAASTTSKLISAYLRDSIASSMVNASEDQSDIEELLRH